jgi:hypothetical protein
MCRFILFFSFLVVFVQCNVRHDADCPLCIPMAVHFAFVDSAQTKILMNKVIVVTDKNDSAIVWDTTVRLSGFYCRDTNYWVEGSVGRYKIIYTDSIFGTFSIDSVVVPQNMEYQQCGIVPLTQHIKFMVKRSSSLNKAHSVNSPIISEQFSKGSCG